MSEGSEIFLTARQFLPNAQRSGPKEIRATCPFHRKMDGSPEGAPSFYMSAESGVWFCHGCHERGSLRHFLKAMGVSPFELEGVYQPLLEAIGKFTPARMDPLSPVLSTPDPLPESLLGLFHYVPTLLEREGFREETLSRFDVGFDKDHMRVTFPLRDVWGHLAGVSGRSVTGALPKYKIYDREYTSWGLPARYGAPAEKRALLWNADRLYPALKNELHPRVVLVEGFKACMWVDQAGVKEVTALLGSYISEEQQWILERLGARVYLMLDNNFAGRRGTYYVGGRLCSGLDVLVAEYRKEEEDAQPSDLEEEEVYKALDEAVDYHLWKTENRQYSSKTEEDTTEEG